MSENQTTSWQPIETAPRDGTEVLIVEAGVRAVAAWHGRAGWIANGDRDAAWPWSPTHWMPLPEPPNAE